MRRELGENTNSVAESSQRKNELKGATTTDTSNITDRSKKQQPKQSKTNGAPASAKSTKQMNLADWVSSGIKTSASKPIASTT